MLHTGQLLTPEGVTDELLQAFRAGMGRDAAEQGVLFDDESGSARPEGFWLVGCWSQRWAPSSRARLERGNAQQHDLDVAGMPF